MIVDEDLSSMPWFKMATARYEEDMDVDMDVGSVTSTVPGIYYKVVCMKLKTTTPDAAW